VVQPRVHFNKGVGNQFGLISIFIVIVLIVVLIVVFIIFLGLGLV
jgi:hypothetical protein